MDELKRCRKCGEEKPFTDEYWRRKKGKLIAPCLECNRARDRAAKKAEYDAKPEMRRERSRRWRAENPGKVQKMNRAWYETHRDHIREYNRTWRAANVEKLREWNRQWRAANLEKVRAIVREWHRTHPEKIQQWGKAWREANVEKIREKNHRWQVANRHKRVEYSHRRRALLLNAEGSHTSADVRRIYLEQAAKCAYCQRDMHGRYEVDHVTPLSRGGSNYPENLACTCRRCNRSKGSKTLTEWKSR
jgi:5-methylcytosine-specific restriction endonuclease McrA